MALNIQSLDRRTMLKRLGAFGIVAPFGALAACTDEERTPSVATAPTATASPADSMDHSAPLGGASATAKAQAHVTLDYMLVPEMAPPITRTSPAEVTIKLEARDVRARLAEGVGYDFWTFNGSVPGPMLRVRQDDMATLSLTNKLGNSAGHNIDLHAVTGPEAA
ncbi:MAG: hypothetical protein EXR66_09075 [Dehalococcoidia bacterium]|nr:hypothetical protein [Dehalococcoidia bacterium]